MNITYRMMRPEEISDVRKLIRSCFPIFYYPMVGKIKDAVIALDGERIVGGSVFKTIKGSHRNFGYLEWGFTDKEYRGKGIGRETYNRALDQMRSDGCTELASLVLDDNSGSWKQFAHHGMKRLSVGQAIRVYGLSDAMKLWFASFAVFAMGSSLWCSSEEHAYEEIPDRSMRSILIVLMANLLLIFGQGSMFGRSVKNNSLVFLAFMTYYLGMMALKLLITSGSMKPVLRVWRTGQLIPVIVIFMGGLFPIFGDVYPDRGNDWDVRDHRKVFGISSAVCWMVTLIGAVITTLIDRGYFLSYLQSYLVMFLFLDILVVIFESFDGARVYRWKRTVYWVLAVISIIVLIWILFFT